MFHEKVIGPASKMRGDFLVELKRLPPPPGCNTRYDRWVFGAHSIARALLSGKHLVPRWGFDHVVKSFLKLGASLRELKVNMMGGRQDHLIPAEAFFDYKSKRREIVAK
jgi:predicted Abi (CAAX) family protease